MAKTGWEKFKDWCFVIVLWTSVILVAVAGYFLDRFRWAL